MFTRARCFQPCRKLTFRLTHEPNSDPNIPTMTKYNFVDTKCGTLTKSLRRVQLTKLIVFAMKLYYRFGLLAVILTILAIIAYHGWTDKGHKTKLVFEDRGKYY